MRRLSKSSLQAATCNRRSTFSPGNKQCRLFSSKPLDHVVRQSSACGEQSEMSGLGQGSAKIRRGRGQQKRGLFWQRDWQEGNLRFHQHFLVLLPLALWGNLILFVNWVYEAHKGFAKEEMWRCYQKCRTKSTPRCMQPFQLSRHLEWKNNDATNQWSFKRNGFYLGRVSRFQDTEALFPVRWHWRCF